MFELFFISYFSAFNCSIYSFNIVNVELYCLIYYCWSRSRFVTKFSRAMFSCTTVGKFILEKSVGPYYSLSIWSISVYLKLPIVSVCFIFIQFLFSDKGACILSGIVISFKLVFYIPLNLSISLINYL